MIVQVLKQCESPELKNIKKSKEYKKILKKQTSKSKSGHEISMKGSISPKKRNVCVNKKKHSKKVNERKSHEIDKGKKQCIYTNR